MLSPDHHTRRQIVVDHQEALRRLAARPVRREPARRFTLTVLAGPPPLSAGAPRRFRLRRRPATAS